METERTSPGLAGPRNIQLPRSSTRLQKPYAHCKVLTEVRLHQPLNTGFEGRIYPPGAVVPASELGKGVVLECVGPEKPARGRQTPVTWILWRWDEGREEWRELARAAAVGAEWAAVLRRPAYEALHPDPELVDVISAGRDAAEEIMGVIDQRIAPAPEVLKGSILAVVYDLVAGRIAAAR